MRECQGRDHADRRVHVLLCLRRVRLPIEADTWRLLRVLLLWHREVPADSGRSRVHLTGETMADRRETTADTVELRPQLVQTIEHLTARWASADTPVLKHVFALLAEGRPVSPDRLAEASGMTTDLAAKAIGSGRVTLDGNGDIVELFGVTLTETPHRVHADGAALYSCCALVAHVVPRLLGRPVEIHSKDPITGDHVELEIAPNGLRNFQPNTAIASMIVTDERTIHEDAPVHFCRHVRHFVSRKDADEFVTDNRGRYVLTIRELDAAAWGVYSAIWS